MDMFLELKNKMSQLGYPNYQIENMIKENLGRTNINDIGIDERKRLIAFFEEYIVFANKCKKVK
jgi:hypothetical protein